MGNTKTTVMTVRLPNDLAEAIKREARIHKFSHSRVMANWLREVFSSAHDVSGSDKNVADNDTYAPEEEPE